MAQVQIIERGEQRDALGEGLLWSARDQAVYWTDILAPALNRLTLATGKVERWAMPERIGWVIERRDHPRLIAGFQSGFAELSLDPLSIVLLADPEPDLPDNRLNDAKADQRGRIFAGTMPVGADRPTGGFYRFDPDHSVHCLDDGYTVANGPAISPDGAWLYHTDTVPGIVYRFAIQDDGELGRRAEHIRFEREWGRPDGMTVDAEGGLWIASWGGSRVTRFSPEGQVERSIAVPASQITNVCFAGDALDRMFITSAREGREDEPAAGCLFEVDPGVRGLAPHQFAG